MWRIGTVPYLNARTLFETLLGRADVALMQAVPSELAVELRAGRLDVALVSSVVHLGEPGLVPLDAPGVASCGPVRSIRLFSRKEPRDIRTLALDTSSRTGVVLGRLMLQRVYGAKPEVVPMPPCLDAMLQRADACVLIGDPALQADHALQLGVLPEMVADIDLGELWTERTGLPFVFAVWTAPADVNRAPLERLLRGAAAEGDVRREAIARREAAALGLPEEMCVSYLFENVRNVFGPAEREGLAQFHRWAAEDGLLPAPPSGGARTSGVGRMSR